MLQKQMMIQHLTRLHSPTIDNPVSRNMLLKNISLGSGSILSSGSPKHQLKVHQSLFLAGPASTKATLIRDLKIDPSPRSALSVKNKIHLQGMLKKKAIEYLKN